MFPLGTVLLPGEALPLHVFEPRYRAMVQDCMASADGPRFGVVLITRGREVGGGDERADVATMARIVELDDLGDGRFALMVIAGERLRVRTWLPDDPYPQADVEPWPDDLEPADDLSELFAQAIERVADVRELAAASSPESPLVPPPPTGRAELPDDDGLAAYRLASHGLLGQADRFRVLTASGPAQRLRVLSEALDDVAAALRFRTQ